MTGPRPRVLLVEDDSSLRRFIEMALEEIEINLVSVPTVDEALVELGRGPVALILTDLMLPGRSGFDLIDALAADPALLGAARVAVLSAGLDPKTRQRLDRPEVWRLLSKPCSVAALEDCVHSALKATVPTPAVPAPGQVHHPRAAAIAEHFGGNTVLYEGFRSSCLEQFHADSEEGDRFSEGSDAAALRRLAHSLKSVLLTLGHPDESALAADLELACEHADWTRAAPGWRALRAALMALNQGSGNH